jgi:hypothetical protein
MVGIGIFLTGLGINPAITIHYSFVNEHTSKNLLTLELLVGKFRDV